LNDPNGLLYYKGEYHLFYQNNPLGTFLGGYAHWGHAIGTDLVHWTELPQAIYPGESGHIFSGSGVVDWNNTTGFKTGPDDPMVVAYCAPIPMQQEIAFSTDRGRTWRKYQGNPVLPRFAKNNGDPKIFWYEPTRRWIMISTFPKENYGFFSSPNLKDWKLEQIVSLPGSECPDFFSLQVVGQETRKWVLTTNPLTYFTGDYDGHIFKPDPGPGQRLDWGFCYHSAQTFNEVPAADGRRIQIAWMQDVASAFYHQTLFNEQMSFPAVLTLHQVPEGLRVYREPIKEVEKLHDGEQSWTNLPLNPGENPLSEVKGDLFDIRAEIEMGTASDCGFSIRGVPINYSAKEKKLSLLVQRNT
jgi:sucrose-6-phosphate hydrolase SacC (GH32 family)